MAILLSFVFKYLEFTLISEWSGLIMKGYFFLAAWIVFLKNFELSQRKANACFSCDLLFGPLHWSAIVVPPHTSLSSVDPSFCLQRKLCGSLDWEPLKPREPLDGTCLLSPQQISTYRQGKFRHLPSLTPRAGLQCFLSVPWVIAKTDENYNPSTKI